MPVLNKISHKNAQLPENLKPDDRVFCIPGTKEVFRDYRAFFDRMMLYNTSAWSCSVSGKNGFTFKEAMDCENQTRNDVDSFQQSLKVPVLYLITLIKRRSCSDLVDELVGFIKDRFFVNEDVFYTGDNGEKLPAVVKKVYCDVEKAAPPSKPPRIAGDDDDEDDDDDECLATIAAQNKNPPPSAYKYDIKLVSAGSATELSGVSASQLSRKKNALSKDKLKLFVKAQCRSGSDGFWKVRTHLMALGLEDADAISSFFVLPVPKFRPPVESQRKRASKASSPEGKQKKQKSKKKTSKKPEPENKARDKKSKKPIKAAPKPDVKPVELKPLTKEELAAQRRFEFEQKKLEKLEDHKRQIEERKLERERQKEEKVLERQRQLEERKRQIEYMREYNKPRDDMQCEDLRPLPRATSIQLKHIDTKLFPEIVYVIEFCHIFREFLELDLSQLTIKNLENAVRPFSSNQPLDGLFYDLVTSLLRIVFDYRKAENEDVENEDEGQEDIEADVDLFSAMQKNDMSTKSLLKISKACAHKSHLRYGMDVDVLPLNTSTLSEVLRLHILASAALRPLCGSDEPSIDFCRLEQEIVNQLSQIPVFDLGASSKLKLLRLLMDQLLVFADFREFIEESFEKVKETKARLAEVQVEHAKWIKVRDFSAAKERSKLKPTESKEENADAANKDDSKETEEEKKQKRELKKRAQLLQRCITAFQQQEVEPFVELTRRSSRRGAAGGPTSAKSATELLLEDPQSEALIFDCNIPILAHISEEECLTFDRWRQQTVAKRLAAVEQELLDLSNMVLLHQRIYNLRPLGQDRSYRRYWTFSMVPGLFVEEPDDEIPKELLTPIQQINPLPDNSEPLIPEPLIAKWGFYSSPADIERLCEDLNPRGFRESGLKESLNRQRGSLLSNLDKCPIEFLVSPKDPDCEMMEKSVSINNSLDLQLRDQLLELEDKIFLGSLGVLQVPDRLAWREAIMKGLFASGITEIKYGVSCSESIPELQPDANSSSQSTDVHSLAIALIQIEQGIDRKFVKAPLWPNMNDQKGNKAKSSKSRAAVEDANDEENSKASDATPAKPTIALWEESLMRCTSLSQLFLHLATLDSSVLWSRSILKAHCRICRRRADPASMLLCDGCNLGFHCYCLRPPLKKIPEGDWYCHECKPENFTSSRVGNRRRGRQANQVNKRKEEVEEDEEEEVKPTTSTTKSQKRGRVVETDEESESRDIEMVASKGDEESEDEEQNDGSSSQSEDGSENESENEDSENEDASAASRTTSSRTNNDSDDESEGVERGSDSGDSDGSNNAASSDEDGSDNESGSGDGEGDGGSEDGDASDGSDYSASRKHRKAAPITGKKRQSRSSRYSESNDSSNSSSPVCACCSASAVDEMAYVRCDNCATVFHLDCVHPTPLSRKPRGGWVCYSCTNKPARKKAVASSQPAQSHHQPERQPERQPPKRDAFEYASSSSNSLSAWPSSRSDLSMKRAEQLVTELIKHEDAWPFLKPVNKKQVPDYFDIIKTPMDLGTVKVRINDVVYKDTGSLLDDCQLIFDNCFAYNHHGEPVFEAGVGLCKYFLQRCRDLQVEGSWPSFKAAVAKLAKQTGSEGVKRTGGNSLNGSEAAPAKQSRRG